MCTTEKHVLTHIWQEQGLGVAPFRAVAIISVPSTRLCEANPTAYNNAMQEACESANGFGVHLCTCYACGQSLCNNVVIRDANGAHFVVGMDCAAKTADSRLIRESEALERARQKQLRQEKQEREWQERQERRNAELQAQRDRNGGFTDAEVAQRQQEEKERAEAAKHTTDNAWLISVLDKAYQGEFVASIVASLERKPLQSAVYGSAANIVAEIYAKTAGGRRGSKKYDAAEQEFWNRYGND